MPVEIKNILIAIAGPGLILLTATIVGFRHEITAMLSTAWLFISDREAWRQRNQGDRFDRRELLKIMLSLDETSRTRLFELYRERFGAGPARYAKKTYLKWRTGDVRPVNSTFRRFAVELPRVMNFDLKCEVLRTFVNEFSPKEHVEMTVSADDWEAKLRPVVERMISRCYASELPAEVERRLRWLGEGDMRAAADLLKHSRAEETRLAVSTLRQEFESILILLNNPGLSPVITHEIRIPGGTIELKVRK